MAQERVRGDGEMQLVAATLPPRGPDLAHEHLVVRLGRREGREVVRAHERSGALLELLEIDGSRPPESPTRAQRGTRPCREHDVPVRPCRRRESRVESDRRLLRLEDGDVVGQRGVERLGEPRHRWAALGVEARDLPGRMNARVGPAGDGEAAPGRQDGVERLAQRALDRPLARLPRPAAKPGPVVLERQPEGRHAMLLTQVASAQTPVEGRSRMSNKRNAASATDLRDVHEAHVTADGVTSSTRPSTATTGPRRPAGGPRPPAPPRSHRRASPAHAATAPGRRRPCARRGSRRRPSARRRFDQRTKNVVSTTSIAAAPATATTPHGDGRTVSARMTATIVSMGEG